MKVLPLPVDPEAGKEAELVLEPNPNGFEPSVPKEKTGLDAVDPTSLVVN